MTKLCLESTIKLKSGYEMPVLGYGLWKTPPEQATEVVTEALKQGYRHIDSAASYKNEGGAALAVKQAAATVPRSSIFFTSKVRKVSYDLAKAQVDATLRETGFEYIDLMLLHAPYGGSEARKGGWRALVEAVEAGKVRSIGVSNYGVHHLEELEAYIAELEEERGKGRGGVLSAGQYEIHPWCARGDITAWLKERGVAVEAYSPLVRGERWDEPVLKRLAEKYGKSQAQVLVRWSLQKGFVPLPKSVTPARIRSNTEVFDFELTEEEVKDLETGEYSPVCWDPTIIKLEE
ncbi:2,5-diketo-D-gluconic acid reductase A [Coniochaeta sp. 2T2.1]|nr:2,5-diketo-D-gluconic acid reductase A [Coniochaeta sp. 2T2.1]